MPCLDVETRWRVVLLRKAGYRVGDIKERLVEERIVVSERSIHKHLHKERITGLIIDKKRPKRTKLLSDEQLRFIDDELVKNDELMAR